ncbi:MAG: GNAT family N-acetyltransferase [Pirellulales bacterium]|nr:GNAT family N-acetyltransferase [Pirellulales bacterium]
MTTDDDDPSVVIAPCALADRRAALALLCRRLPLEERERHLAALLNSVSSGSPSQAELLVARDRGRLLGGVLVEVQPGRTALLHAPGTTDTASYDELAPRLIAAALVHCRREHVRLVQSLLETDTGCAATALATSGLQHRVDLLYLVSTRDHFPDTMPSTPLEFVPVEAGEEARLAQIIERTYVDSRDCPELDGAREMRDVIEGYRPTGTAAAAPWFFVRKGDRDVGCLLLSDYPAHDQWELVYMGLAPEVRGRTLGMDVARYAQWRARCAARGKLVLAVDAANEPALKMYSACGFLAWDRRSVFVRLLES